VDPSAFETEMAPRPFSLPNLAEDSGPDPQAIFTLVLLSKQSQNPVWFIL